MIAKPTESQRRWMRRIMRAAISLGFVAIGAIVLASTGVIPTVWLFVGILSQIGVGLGVWAWMWLIVRRARRQSSN
jgi:hypothetical protein